MYEIPEIGHNPWTDPNLLEEAAGNAALLQLLAEEQTAALSLFHDPHDSDKLDHFTSKRDAVLAYQQYLTGKVEQPPTTG